MAFATVTDRYTEEEIASFYESGQWRPETLLDYLDAHVAAQPDRVFITDDNLGLTFRELRDQALALAAALAARGMRAGDRVAVQMPSWVEFAVITTALSRLGAIMVPIMPIYRTDEVGYILENSGARMVITAATFKKYDYEAMYVGLRPQVVALEDIVLLRVPRGDRDKSVLLYDELLAEGAGVDPDSLGPGAGPDDAIVIVYSSGTTARPKGCLHTLNTFGCGSRYLAKGWGYSTADVQFGPSPVTHTTGLVTSILVPLMHGARTHIMESWVPSLGAEQIAEHGCSVRLVTATTFLGHPPWTPTTLPCTTSAPPGVVDLRRIADPRRRHRTGQGRPARPHRAQPLRAHRERHDHDVHRRGRHE